MGRVQGTVMRTALKLQKLGIVAMLAFTPVALAAQPLDNSENSDFVSDIFPYPIEEIYARLQTQFDSEARSYYEDYNRFIYDLPEKVLSYKELSPEAYRKFMALPMIKPTKFYVFYGAYATTQHTLQDITPLSVVGIDNPALVRYASLPLQARRYDLYLWSPDVPYWYSEYTIDGVPLPFRTYFILHLSSPDKEHTSVEVIEEKPVVRMSNKITVDEHGKLRHFEVRDVAPTARERKFLLSCIQQFIETNYPDRHRFNCRPPEEKQPAMP